MTGDDLFTPASETVPVPVTDWREPPANPAEVPSRAGVCVDCGNWAKDRCCGLCAGCWDGQRGNR